MIEQHFRTSLNVEKSDHQLRYQNKSLFIGSCFSAAIGKRLSNRCFDVTLNPTGIVYNPISIARALKRIFSEQEYFESDLFQYDDRWLSFEHHSSFSNRDKKTCLRAINDRQEGAIEVLKNLQTVFVTLGSAWVYERKENKLLVANCHKIPQREFSKRMLSVDEIVADLTQLLEEAEDQFPKLKFVFTVSPIRHLKDGVVADRLSKSTLLVAVHELVERRKNASYFPAYEMIIDDLRDYRFYERDMIHPNELARDYIWEHFKNSYISETEYPLISELEQLYAAVSHRPFDSNSKAHQKFVHTQLAKIQDLESKHDFLKLKSYSEKLKSQLLE